MIPVFPTRHRMSERPDTKGLLRVTEVPKDTLAQIPAHVHKQYGNSFTDRLFEVANNDANSCYVRTNANGADARCLTHAVGVCDAVARVQRAGVVGEKTLCVCGNPLFDGTPLETVEPVGRHLRKFKIHKRCALEGIEFLANLPTKRRR